MGTEKGEKLRGVAVSLENTIQQTPGLTPGFLFAPKLITNLLNLDRIYDNWIDSFYNENGLAGLSPKVFQRLWIPNYRASNLDLLKCSIERTLLVLATNVILASFTGCARRFPRHLCHRLLNGQGAPLKIQSSR